MSADPLLFFDKCFVQISINVNSLWTSPDSREGLRSEIMVGMIICVIFKTLQTIGTRLVAYLTVVVTIMLMLSLQS